MSIHGGRVANALGCNARGHGFAPQSRRNDLFLESIQSPAQRDLNGLCDIVEFTVTCDVGGDNW